ncbi:replication initiation protein [Bacillus megaterium]|nr:replication initiation protein [Priestia megaterium]
MTSFLAIEPTKYKQYGHFKSKVLAVAQKEINNKTDIHFEFVEIKTGRKVTSIEFIITSSPALNDASATKEKTRIKSTLSGVRRSRKQCSERFSGLRSQTGKNRVAFIRIYKRTPRKKY